jgi:drug/metabolite transporter (DMT)-like permease
MSSRGVLRCAIAAVLFGVSAPAASRLVDDVGTFTLAGLLYLGAALAVAPLLVRNPPTATAVRRGGGRLATAVVVGGAIGPVLLAAGLGHVSAATASLLLNLELVFTIIIAGLVFKEHIGRRIGVGTAMVVAASLLLGWSDDPDLRWGALLIAAACFCWAIDNSVTAALDQLAPAHITFAKGTIAGGANLAIGLTLDGAPQLSATAAALLVGAIGYGVSITLWVAGARELGAARAQLVFATAPFVGAVVAWTILGDEATGRELVSLLIAAAGVTFVMHSDHEHEHRHLAVEHDHEHSHTDSHHEHVHAGGFTGRHQHSHTHGAVIHAHPHVPDLHHRHGHDT